MVDNVWDQGLFSPYVFVVGVVTPLSIVFPVPSVPTTSLVFLAFSVSSRNVPLINRDTV